MRRTAFLVAIVLIVGSVVLAANFTGAASNAVYGCFDANGVQTSRRLQQTVPTCASTAHWVNVTTGEEQVVATTTTQPTTTTNATTTTLPATTTQPATTTTAATTTTGVTTTTQPSGSTFMSYPLQSCTTSVSGTNVIVSNKSWRGCRGSSALVVSNATNVYLHDLDFDSNSGDIFLVNTSGNIRIENVRARNTGAGRTTNGSGQGEVIQLANSWQGSPCTETSCTAGIRNVKNYGGNTEDMISIYKSGGLDPSHLLIIEDNHMESPLPPDPLAWSSGSGTCFNNSDDDIQGNPPGGHDIVVRYNTALNCGQALFMMNRPLRVHQYENIAYSSGRVTNNVGMTQWASANCSACLDNSYERNRIWFLRANGSPAPFSLSGTAQVADIGNVKQDPTINPANLHVVL